MGFEGWIGVHLEENYLHFIHTFDKHVPVVCSPCTEQSWEPKADMASVLTKFLIWEGHKYHWDIN